MTGRVIKANLSEAYIAKMERDYKAAVAAECCWMDAWIEAIRQISEHAINK